MRPQRSGAASALTETTPVEQPGTPYQGIQGRLHCTPQTALSPAPRTNTREVTLTRGLVSLVDEEDFEMLSAWSWTYHPSGYAMRVARVGGRQIGIFMHRFLMLPDPDQYVDHVNRDKLDNRRSNLRVCSPAQNAARASSTGGRQFTNFRGVSPAGYRWSARITAARKPSHLGYFATDIEAARAYDAAAIELYGELAVLNFPVVPS